MPTYLAVKDGEIKMRGYKLSPRLLPWREDGGFLVVDRVRPANWVSPDCPQVGGEHRALRDPRHDPRIGDALLLDGEPVTLTSQGYLVGGRFVPWCGRPAHDLTLWTEAMRDAEVVTYGSGEPTPKLPEKPPRTIPDISEKVRNLVAQRGRPMRQSEIRTAIGCPTSWVLKAVKRLVDDGRLVRTVTSDVSQGGQPFGTHAVALPTDLSIDAGIVRFPSGESIDLFELLIDEQPKGSLVTMDGACMCAVSGVVGTLAVNATDMAKVSRGLAPITLAEGRQLARKWLLAVVASVDAAGILTLDQAYEIAAISYRKQINLMRGAR